MATNDPDEPLLTITTQLSVLGIVLPTPDVAISTEALHVEMEPGEELTRIVEIANEGTADLHWSAAPEDDDLGWATSGTERGNRRPAGDGVDSRSPSTPVRSPAGELATDLVVTSDDPDEPTISILDAPAGDADPQNRPLPDRPRRLRAGVRGSCAGGVAADPEPRHGGARGDPAREPGSHGGGGAELARDPRG